MSELGQCECEQYADICNDCFEKYIQAEREKQIDEFKKLSDKQIIYRIRKGKHYFTPQDDDNDFCKICGDNFRNTNVHIVVDEQ